MNTHDTKTVIIEADTLRKLQDALRNIGASYTPGSGWHCGPNNLHVPIFWSNIDGAWFTSLTEAHCWPASKQTTTKHT
jgi:hypothetical protein